MLSQSTKREIFDTFLKEVDGKGRCFSTRGICAYAMVGHPGCAIGCQPKFQKACKELGINMLDQEGSISTFVEEPSIYKKQIDAIKLAWPEFDPMTDDFLNELQKLHDLRENWEGLKLKKEKIKEFAIRTYLSFEDK